MKKIIVICSVILILSAAAAKADEKTGEVYTSDIGAMIDKQPILSYNFNDFTYVIAEELTSYGFDVVWHADTLELTIDKNNSIPQTILDPDEINVKKTDKREKIFDVYSTDIKTYIDGKIADTKSINGRMLVKLRDLDVFGEVTFDSKTRVAELNTVKFQLEKQFAKAEANSNIQTLQLSDSDVYTGEVKDGKPHGIGKITKTKNVDIYDYVTEINGRWAPVIKPLEIKRTEKATAVYLGNFEDGQKTGMFYVSGRQAADFYNTTSDDTHKSKCPHKSEGFVDVIDVEKVSIYSQTVLSSLYTNNFDLYGEYKSSDPCSAHTTLHYLNGYLRTSLSDSPDIIIKNMTGTENGGEGLINSVYNEISGKYEQYAKKKNKDYLFGYEIIAPEKTTVAIDGIKFKEFTPNGCLLDENYNVYEKTFTDGEVKARGNAKDAAFMFGRKGIVLARDGKVYRINDKYDDSADDMILENIKTVTADNYLDNYGNLYYTDYDEIYQKIADNVEVLKASPTTGGAPCFYMTKDKKLFYVYKDEIIFVAEDIKDFFCDSDNAAYITNNGDVYYWRENKETLFIGSGAVSACADIYMITYLTENGELFAHYITGYGCTPYYLSRGNNTEKITDGIKAAVCDYDGGILALKENGDVYLYTRLESEPILVGNNITALSERFYMLTEDGNVWLVRNDSEYFERYKTYVSQIFPGRQIRITYRN